MTSVFSDLKNNHWTENLELACLTAMLVSIPFSSGVTLALTCLWLLVVILKNTLLKRWSFFGFHQDKDYQHYYMPKFLYLMMAYWLMYLLSMLWTQNQVAGWAEVGALMCFAFFPLIYAITDFRQVKRAHLRIMLWLFVLAMSCLFWLRFAIVASGYKSGEDSFIWYMLTQANDFYVIHHSYMSVYLLTGLAFLYTEIWNVRQSRCKCLLLTAIVVCALSLCLFLMCINSRAGLLCLLLLLGMCWFHIVLVKRKYTVGVASLIVVALMVCAVHFVLPDHFRNLSSTVAQVMSGNVSDGRVEIMGNAITVIKDNPILGVGAGDRMDVLAPFYENNPEGIVYNPHNQYLDAFMTTGVGGFLILLCMMVFPAINAWKRKKLGMLMMMVVWSVSLLFESMFERQMGFVFFCLMMILFGISGYAEVKSSVLNQK